MCGFAQRVAFDRNADFFESHSFTHPVRSLDSAQPQWQPPVWMGRSSPGVLARTVMELPSNAIPATKSAAKRREPGSLSGNDLPMRELSAERERKAIGRSAWEFCYGGHRTALGGIFLGSEAFPI